jgi:hypothetical protein
MSNKGVLSAMLAIVLAFGVMFVGCDMGGDPNQGNNPDVPPVTKDPLSGTVTISSAVTDETMTLTADVSGLDIGTFSDVFYSYQWQRDGVNISGATKKTYDITEADYNKTIKVIVSHSYLSGYKEAQSTNHTPKSLTLTLKWDADADKQDTYIVIERVDGSYWANVTGPNQGVNLNTTGTTITLYSYQEAKFKMRTFYKMIDTEFYFQKDNAQGSDEFDFENGTKSYTLTNVEDNFGVLTGLFATEN